MKRLLTPRRIHQEVHLLCLFYKTMSGFRFGPHLIQESQIFFKSKLSIGIVNLKPIAP